MISVIAALFAMARPLIMLSVVLVYAAGLLLVWARTGALDATGAAWGGAALLLVTLAIHYANEYADWDTDRLTTPTPFSGGSGVARRGGVRRGLALAAAWAALLAGVAVGAAALALGHVSPAAFGLLLAGAAGGWLYSLPPLRLAWRGWGEVDNALLGGLVLPLYACAAGGLMDGFAALQFIPFTLLAFTNLLATTWADRHADGAVGKRTLAVRLPPERLRTVYAAAVLACIAAAAAWSRSALAGLLVALPLLIWGFGWYTRRENPFPSVAAMLALLLGQMAAWLVLPVA